MKRILLFVMLLLVPVAAHAQTPPLVSDTLQVYAPGVDPTVGSPTQTTIIPESAFTCNQAQPTVPATVVNPTTVVKDDPVNAGKACITSSAGSFLLALPNTPGLPNVPGNWTATLTVTDSLNVTSARSAASNTFQLDRVNAPTGIRVK